MYEYGLFMFYIFCLVDISLSFHFVFKCYSFIIHYNTYFYQLSQVFPNDMFSFQFSEIILTNTFEISSGDQQVVWWLRCWTLPYGQPWFESRTWWLAFSYSLSLPPPQGRMATPQSLLLHSPLRILGI